MRTANEYEIAIFKKEYCKNGEARISIGKDFEVDVESFEELLPGKIVSSYATGNRDIENSFIMFRVCDVIKDIQYFPVFSETVGRKMLKSWNKPVPKKKALTEAQERLNARCEQIKSQVFEIKVQVKSTAKNIVDETKAKGGAALYRGTEFVGIKKRLLNVRTAVFRLYENYCKK